MKRLVPVCLAAVLAACGPKAPTNTYVPAPAAPKNSVSQVPVQRPYVAVLMFSQADGLETGLGFEFNEQAVADLAGYERVWYELPAQNLSFDIPRGAFGAKTTLARPQELDGRVLNLYGLDAHGQVHMLLEQVLRQGER